MIYAVFPTFFAQFPPFFRQHCAPFDYNGRMHPLLAALTQNLDLPSEPCLAAPLFLQYHGYAKTAEHSQAVAAECLANIMGEGPNGERYSVLAAAFNKSIGDIKRGVR